MEDLLKELDLKDNILSGTYAGKWLDNTSSPQLSSFSPIDNKVIAKIQTTSTADYELVVESAVETARKFKELPAPKRGEIVREIGNEIRRLKKPLGRLISLEMGKILAEGEGEIQEVIDIAEFAVGLSRQLYGLSMHSERAEHRMYEQWHPLGAIGVITAFNFPAAVWGWNAMIAAICGNSVVWKPSELTPLVSITLTKLSSSVTAAYDLPGLFTLVTGDGDSLGKRLAADKRLPLISATGSCRMGRSVAQTVASRLGRCLLELGGNNAVIILEDADIELAIRGVVFGAVGTAGQRCTSTRRLLIHKSIFPTIVKRLISAYKQIKVGNPLEAETLMGPLINESAVENYQNAIGEIKSQGGEILFGGSVLENKPGTQYVSPTLIKGNPDMSIVSEETFAPILYLMEIDSLEQAIEINNSVPQGLSSAVFTRDLKSVEQFLSYRGSDCGIANVNLGTSGAEIGGAFGGEKDTGGGREAGSDSWKAYMRRQTNTINWGDSLPLAQGIKFG